MLQRILFPCKGIVDMYAATCCRLCAYEVPVQWGSVNKAIQIIKWLLVSMTQPLYVRGYKGPYAGTVDCWTAVDTKQLLLIKWCIISSITIPWRGGKGLSEVTPQTLPATVFHWVLMSVDKQNNLLCHKVLLNCSVLSAIKTMTVKDGGKLWESRCFLIIAMFL